MIPEEHFGTFVTDPVDAFVGVDNTHIWHILVPNPNGQKLTLIESLLMEL
jgi:hypothetical protein